MVLCSRQCSYGRCVYLAPAVFLALSLFWLSHVVWRPAWRPWAAVGLDAPATTSSSSSTARPSTPPTVLAAGNATLGAANEQVFVQFEVILALSPHPSWRTRGLQAAARETGLEVQIPPQPTWPESMVQVFGEMGPPEATHPSRGATKAWLAHIDLLKFVIQSDWETALIVEDDVDWDVAIRNQSVRLAEAVRGFTNTSAEVAAPYGHGWDLLWMGNCGDYWEDSFETWTYEDEKVIPREDFTGWSKPYLERLPASRRSIYWSFNPICTHGFAVTREGARKLLRYVSEGQGEAYDVKVMQGCKEKKYACITVAPEIMHAYTAPKGIPSLIEAQNGKEDSGNVRDEIVNEYMGYTENILDSARCYALFKTPCLSKPTR